MFTFLYNCFLFSVGGICELLLINQSWPRWWDINPSITLCNMLSWEAHPLYLSLSLKSQSCHRTCKRQKNMIVPKNWDRPDGLQEARPFNHIATSKQIITHLSELGSRCIASWVSNEYEALANIFVPTLQRIHLGFAQIPDLPNLWDNRCAMSSDAKCVVICYLA